MNRQILHVSQREDYSTLWLFLGNKKMSLLGNLTRYIKSWVACVCVSLDGVRYRYISLFMWKMLCVILYMVHNQGFLWREANEIFNRCRYTLPYTCTHFYRAEQLLSEYSLLACQYHIDDKDPTLLMHIPFLVSQVPCTGLGYFWYLVHTAISSFWSNSETL